jgi:uncharacterized protein YdcH (DUF465 family)
MKDIAREKYARLMDEVERIEDLITELEQGQISDPEELAQLKEELAAKKNELARLSDGCGKSHLH